MKHLTDFCTICLKRHGVNIPAYECWGDVLKQPKWKQRILAMRREVHFMGRRIRHAVSKTRRV